MKYKLTNSFEYRVLEELNDDNVMLLLNPSANRVFRVVQYEDIALRDELSTLTAGKLVELKLDRVRPQLNVWQANRPEKVTTKNT